MLEVRSCVHLVPEAIDRHAHLSLFQQQFTLNVGLRHIACTLLISETNLDVVECFELCDCVFL